MPSASKDSLHGIEMVLTTLFSLWSHCSMCTKFTGFSCYSKRIYKDMVHKQPTLVINIMFSGSIKTSEA